MNSWSYWASITTQLAFLANSGSEMQIIVDELYGKGNKNSFLSLPMHCCRYPLSLTDLLVLTFKVQQASRQSCRCFEFSGRGKE